MHDVVRSAIIGFVSGLAGALVVVWISGSGKAGVPPPVQDGHDQSELQARVAALEEPPRIGPPGSAGAQTPNESPGHVENKKSAMIVPDASLSLEARRVDLMRQRQGQISEQLREAGWSDAEIDSLDDIRNAAGLEMEERMYRQMRQTMESNPEAYAVWSQSGTLRESLGEEKYEQYLLAAGRPAKMVVNHLLKGSAGEMAGLRTGDVIRRYGTDRIFTEQDLMKSALRGEPGDTVTIEVERDGVIFYLSVPRGPLGTSRIVGSMFN